MNDRDRINKDRYNYIVKKKPKIIKVVEARPPIPEQKDYDKGYITRYFARQANSPQSEIIEVEKKKYTKIVGDSTGFYKTINLDWKITGELNSKLVNGIKHIGVLEANENSIKDAEKTLPGISSVLGNLIKYYKGDSTTSSTGGTTGGGTTGGGGGY